MKNALIITDNVQVREDFQRIIDRDEFQIHQVSSTNELQSALQSKVQGPALIFVDPTSQAFRVTDILQYKRKQDVLFTLPVMVRDHVGDRAGQREILDAKTFLESVTDWTSTNVKAA